MCARRSDPTNDPSTVFSQHQHTSDGMNAHQQLPYANGSMQQLPPPSNHTAPVGQLRGNTEPTSGYRANHQFSLEVGQQPIRARMCGFGDKDRRPITPPPCVRLVVKDTRTSKEVDFSEVDGTYFILTVDLWNEQGTGEVNLVKSSSNSPTVSISNASTTSYPPPLDRPLIDQYGRPMAIYKDAYHQPVYAPVQNQTNVPYAPQAVAGPPQIYAAPPPYNYQPPPGMTVVMPMYPAPGMQVMYPSPMYAPTAASGMFTRNLIGSLSVNAFRLTDTNEKVGFWFVLQDLSVRTEGTFRLKMNFIDVGDYPGESGGPIKGRAPVLATCFSDPFQVYSAKKFPGVIESTPLSKCFANQGIKIPIRKDGPKAHARGGEDDDED
ncbi:hypothetical protein LTR66_010597 [Elasticomyces elasticus]|nr:hypothetical protein LTR66_010597 [Elasticomyces elasticus]